METNITLDALKAASDTYSRLSRMRSYVSKDRFVFAAKVLFNITEEKRLDRLFGIFSCMEKFLYRMSVGAEVSVDDIRDAVAIGEAAYVDYESASKHVPSIDEGRYSPKDYRKYYYTVGDDRKDVKELEVNLGDGQNIVLLADLIKREDVRLVSAVRYIDSIETDRIGRNADVKRVRYYDGDIVFVFGDPSDRIFYSWYNSDAGVYLATPDGWRKLLYTPGRGYIRNGEPDFENDTKYSDYKINKSGNGFRFVGNIHKDAYVLIDREKEEGE